MNQNQLYQKREWIKSKYIIGIDSTKDKHQTSIIDSSGNSVGKSFNFNHNAKGFHDQLWFKLSKYLIPDIIHLINLKKHTT